MKRLAFSALIPACLFFGVWLGKRSVPPVMPISPFVWADPVEMLVKWQSSNRKHDKWPGPNQDWGTTRIESSDEPHVEFWYWDALPTAVNVLRKLQEGGYCLDKPMPFHAAMPEEAKEMRKEKP